MTLLLPSRLTVSRSRKPADRHRPAAPAGRGLRPAAAGQQLRLPAGVASSGSSARPRARDHLARQRARAQDLHLAVDRGAVGGLAGGRHGGARPDRRIRLDDQQRAGVIDRRHRRDGAHAGQPGQEHAAQQQPASAVHGRSTGQRQLVVDRTCRGRWRGRCCASAPSGAEDLSRHDSLYLIEFNLYVFSVRCATMASRRGWPPRSRTARPPPARVTAIPSSSAAPMGPACRRHAGSARARPGPRPGRPGRSPRTPRHPLRQRHAQPAQRHDAAHLVAGHVAFGAGTAVWGRRAACRAEIAQPVSRTSRSRCHSSMVTRAVGMRGPRPCRGCGRPRGRAAGSAARARTPRRRGGARASASGAATRRARGRTGGQARSSQRRPLARRAPRRPASRPPRVRIQQHRLHPPRHDLEGRPVQPERHQQQAEQAPRHDQKPVSGTPSRLATTPRSDRVEVVGGEGAGRDRGDQRGRADAQQRQQPAMAHARRALQAPRASPRPSPRPRSAPTHRGERHLERGAGQRLGRSSSTTIADQATSRSDSAVRSSDAPPAARRPPSRRRAAPAPARRRARCRRAAAARATTAAIFLAPTRSASGGTSASSHADRPITLPTTKTMCRPGDRDRMCARPEIAHRLVVPCRRAACSPASSAAATASGAGPQDALGDAGAQTVDAAHDARRACRARSPRRRRQRVADGRRAAGTRPDARKSNAPGSAGPQRRRQIGQHPDAVAERRAGGAPRSVTRSRAGIISGGGTSATHAPPRARPARLPAGAGCRRCDPRH